MMLAGFQVVNVESTLRDVWQILRIQVIYQCVNKIRHHMTESDEIKTNKLIQGF